MDGIGYMGLPLIVMDVLDFAPQVTNGLLAIIGNHRQSSYATIHK